MVFPGFPAHGIEQLVGVTQSMGNRHPDLLAVERNGALFDTLKTADIVQFDLKQGLTRVNFVGRPDRRFHDASGYSENRAGAGGLAQELVKELRLHVQEVNPRRFDHPGDLPRRDHDIGGAHAFDVEFRSGGLVFLRGTAHDPD